MLVKLAIQVDERLAHTAADHWNTAGIRADDGCVRRWEFRPPKALRGSSQESRLWLRKAQSASLSPSPSERLASSTPELELPGL